MAGRRTLTFHEVVGRGGFGTVYRATLEAGGGFRKDVAVKVLHETGDESAQIAERLRDEARLLGLLRHRALPSVDGLYWVDGRCALVTEYVHGISLLAATRSERLPLGVALEIGAEVASALNAAYAGRGPDGESLRLVHRDVKPANIQLTHAGEVKLLDFGIARAEFEGREAETRHVLLGSVTYMAPERLELVSGPASDVYALAVTLAEAVTGRKMARTSAHPERHKAHVDTALGQLVHWLEGPGVEGFQTLLTDMLAYEMDDRPTAREVERRCRALRRDVPPPFLPDWAEHTIDPSLERQLDDGGTSSLVGRTVEAEDEAPDAGKRAPGTIQLRTLGVVGAAAMFLVGFMLVGLVGLAVLSGVGGGPPSDATDEVVVSPTPPAPDKPDPVPVEVQEPDPLPDPVPDPVPAEVPVAAPAAPAPATPAPAAPEPQPGGTADATAAASPVTASAFGAWLADHPEWLPAAAMADGRADSNHLRDWVDGTPPAGAAWAVDVSFASAEAYCGGRGGLASIAATPTTWPESAGPFQEFRLDGGKPAWLRYDGAVSQAVRRTEANGFTGIRCAR